MSCYINSVLATVRIDLSISYSLISVDFVRNHSLSVARGSFSGSLSLFSASNAITFVLDFIVAPDLETDVILGDWHSVNLSRLAASRITVPPATLRSYSGKSLSSVFSRKSYFRPSFPIIKLITFNVFISMVKQHCPLLTSPYRLRVSFIIFYIEPVINILC